MANRIKKLYTLGQAIWCDNISRHMIDSGDLQQLVELGVVGITSNPTILMKAVTGGTHYDALFNELSAGEEDTHAIYEGLVMPDIADAADILRPVYEETQGVDGYVSLEVNPQLAHDSMGTINEARRLFNELDRPNVLIKVPATSEGIQALEVLISEGVNVNVTLIFGMDVYAQVARAYMDGLRGRAESGGDLTTVASVASFFVSRIDVLIDRLLEEKRAAGHDVDRLLGKAGIASARLAYTCFEELFSPVGGFAALAAEGARVQRPLWASTSTKNPAYPDTMYVDGLIGPQTVNTLPPDTIHAALDHCRTEVTIDEDLDQARATLVELSDLGIDLGAVTRQLSVEGIGLFARSFCDLLENLERKRMTLRAAR